jgi:hypothetical protein
MAAVLVPREDGPHQSEPGMLPSWLLALRELCGAQVGQQRFQHRPEAIIEMQRLGLRGGPSLRSSHHSQLGAPGSRSDGLLKPLLKRPPRDAGQRGPGVVSLMGEQTRSVIVQVRPIPALVRLALCAGPVPLLDHALAGNGRQAP